MKRQNREINIFSISTLDLFASALGAFILLFMILLPYYLKVDPEIMRENRALREENQQLQQQNQQLQAQLQECQAQNARLQNENQALQTQNQQLQQQNQTLQQQLATCQSQNQQLQQQIAELQQQNQQLQQQLQNQQQLQQQLQTCEEARRRAEAQAASCEEKLKYTFLAVAIEWETDNQDIDMHLIDPAGNEFSFQANNRERREYPRVDAELSKDSQRGPGVELWQTANAAKGIYKIYANLYSRHGNSANPTIRSAVFFRDGSKKLPNRTLTREGEKILLATIEVKENGDVEVR